jgi:extradiol dioxygenase family protein
MSIGALRPFHLAIPVTDLVAADAFYCGMLGCDKGRSDTRWIDLNFFGHQLTLHLVADKLHAADIKFIVPPRLKFAGETGEQATMFFFDPAGNALEFKSFADSAHIFDH